MKRSEQAVCAPGAWEGKRSAPDDTPVYRLPYEILSEIFLTFLSGAPKQKWIRLASSTIACVCAVWRAAALNTPQLWLHINWLDVCNTPQLIHAQLLRSRGLPIHLIAIAFNGRDDQQLIKAPLTNLGVCLPRCKSLTLRITYQFLARIPPLDLPFLRNVHLTIRRRLPRQSALDFLAHAPQLRRLSIKTSSDGLLKTVRLAERPTVTTLVLSLTDAHPIIFYLRLIGDCASTLEQLFIDTQARCDEVGQVSHPKTHRYTLLPRLTRADLSSYTHLLLRFITAPCLNHISLSRTNLSQKGGDPFASLLPFLGSANVVETLELRSVWMSPHFLPCVKKLGGVTALMVEENPDSKPLMSVEMMRRMIAWDDDSAPLFPQLDSICVRYGAAYDMPDMLSGLWFDFAVSRTEDKVCEGSGVAVKLLHDYDLDFSWG
ncbi:hypothetical protein BD626DRAFT_492664 [Schizophyllum amplum]|uniref:Uncharacterized protein n=1 Tax=Schizophyllum amplum TaxID=97359 RepID=A0A550CG48_9AGAR|nr:hypothetical protein BD626DRAFT_492664 [Auriculariopsis ampla]